MCAETIKSLKKKLSDIEKEDSEKMANELKCFWTWPFGHIWASFGHAYSRKCAICGLILTNGYLRDGGWHYDLATNDARKRIKVSIALLKKQRRLGLI